VTAGGLPFKLSLSSSGLISGLPEENAEVIVTIEVTDSASPANTTSGDFAITINPTLK
jgi:hypothetical protein